MKATKILLGAVAVLAAVACDKPGDTNAGRGVTETSERYQGVEQPPKWEPQRNPAAHMPTQPAEPTTGSPEAESEIAPGSDDRDKMGTVQTPEGVVGNESAGAAAGATSAPSRDTKPGTRPE